MVPATCERVGQAPLATQRPLPEYVAGSKGGPGTRRTPTPPRFLPKRSFPSSRRRRRQVSSCRPVLRIGHDRSCRTARRPTGRALGSVARAVHLARNHTRRVSPSLLAEAVDVLDRAWMHRTERDLYWSSVDTNDGVVHGLARHTVWSEVYECPSCASAVALWDVAEPDRPLSREIDGDSCGRWFDRRRRVSVASIPRWLTLAPESGGKLVHGDPTAEALHRIETVERRRITRWMPTTPIDPHREMYIRSALHLRGVRTVADMFARRPAIALSRLWHEVGLVEDVAVREALQFAFTNTAWHGSRMRRYNAKGGQRPLTGTLFIPQLVSEPNVFEVFRHQVRQVCRLYEVLPDGDVAVNQSSATDLRWLADNSADYVFTDPPFGSNIHYADCNIVWESWLGDSTDNDKEIVVNKSRRVEHGGKTVGDYQRLLTASFCEAKRVVAKGGRRLRRFPQLR